MGFPFDGLRSMSALASLIGQDIVARSISLTQAAGSVAVQLVTGARLKLGGGTTDYFESNGTTTITTPALFVATAGLSTSNALAAAQVSGSQYVAAPLLYGPGTRPAYQTVVPTISSGFGAGAAITGVGTLAFTLDVGTGGAATSGVIGLPAATTGWALHVQNLTANTATVFLTKQTATTTTTATIGNYDAAGAAAAWTASNILLITAIGY